MDSVETIRAFFGWCAVINAGLLSLMWLALMAAGPAVRGVHARMFGLSEDDLSRAYFQYLAQYKTAIWVFNITPWLALVVLG